MPAELGVRHRRVAEEPPHVAEDEALAVPDAQLDIALTSRLHSRGAVEACALENFIGSFKRPTRVFWSTAQMTLRREDGSTVMSDPASAITAAFTAPLQNDAANSEDF